MQTFDELLQQQMAGGSTGGMLSPMLDMAQRSPNGMPEQAMQQQGMEAISDPKVRALMEAIKRRQMMQSQDLVNQIPGQAPQLQDAIPR